MKLFDGAALPKSWLPWWASFDRTLRAERKAPDTRSTYGYAIGNFAAFVGKGPMEVTRDDVRAYLAHSNETCAAKTVSIRWKSIRRFYRWLVREGELDQSPTEGVTGPSSEEPAVRVLRTEDVRALLATVEGRRDFLSRRDAAILRVFVGTGCRLGEVAGLRLTDLDLDAGTAKVNGKSGSRIVSLGSQSALAIDRYLRARNNHPLANLPDLWLGQRGKLTTYGVQDVVKRRGRQAGVEIHPHAFRHYWADQGKRSRVSDESLMVLGGWKSSDMLRRYGRGAAVERALAEVSDLNPGDAI